MRGWVVLLLIVALLSPAFVASAQEAPTDDIPVVAPEFFLRGRDAVGNESYDQAVVDFSLFILFNPRDARAYFVRGLSYWQLGDMDRAIADLSRALEYAEGVPELRASVYATRAEFYASMGEIPLAISDLDELIALAPSAEAFTNRALMHLSQAEFAEAVSDLDEAILLADGEEPVLYYYRARAKSALFDDEVAANDYLQWVNGIEQRTTEQNPIRPGESITLEFAPSVVHTIPFSARADDTINIVAANLSGDADPLMVIVDSDGLALIGNDETARSGTSAVVAGYHVPEDGDFQLLVTHSITGYNGKVIVLWDE